MLAPLLCAALTSLISWVAHFVAPVSARQLRRIDCLLYTGLAGAAIGSLFMCAMPHTVAHAPFRAFLQAAILGAGGSLLAGTLGRLIGILIPYGRKHEALPRWIGNVCAFIAPRLFVSFLALA